jgi:hypothetical protein
VEPSVVTLVLPEAPMVISNDPPGMFTVRVDDELLFEITNQSPAFPVTLGSVHTSDDPLKKFDLALELVSV